MSSEVKRNWEALARFDPLWAIISQPGKEGNRWDLEEFLATGTAVVSALMPMLAAHGCSVGRRNMLDFGCGVGRLTQAFAAHFEHCVGVDIAEAMVTRAEALNTRPDRVRYHVGEPDSIAFADGTFDFVYSRIVLQHMPVELQARFVGEFIRVIVPGGFAAFQVPSRALGDSGTVFRSPIATPDGIVTIDMNVFPRGDVEDTIAKAGGRLVCAWEDQEAGPKFESYTYVATRD